MKLNEDLTKPAIVHGGKLDWVSSPTKGVDRRMMYRLGEELARATSIVRYAPESSFPAHTHSGGEEYYVLDGVFQDEEGDHPTGSYVRNPPGSRHTPGSAPGCTIIVWLHQFLPTDLTPVSCHTGEVAPVSLVGSDGVRRRVLFDGSLCASVDEVDAGHDHTIAFPHGGEIFVLKGSFMLDDTEVLSRWSWARFPAGGEASLRAQEQGVTLLVRRHSFDPALHFSEEIERR